MAPQSVTQFSTTTEADLPIRDLLPISNSLLTIGMSANEIRSKNFGDLADLLAKASAAVLRLRMLHGDDPNDPPEDPEMSLQAAEFCMRMSILMRNAANHPAVVKE